MTREKVNPRIDQMVKELRDELESYLEDTFIGSVTSGKAIAHVQTWANSQGFQFINLRAEGVNLIADGILFI